MPDSLDTISTATGIPRAEMLTIWGEVKANHALLDACPRHAFVRESPHGPRPGDKYRCRHCSGLVDASAAKWYQDGQKHGFDLT